MFVCVCSDVIHLGLCVCVLLAVCVLLPSCPHVCRDIIHHNADTVGVGLRAIFMTARAKMAQRVAPISL